MATFELTLNGSGDPDDIRAAFESIVNALRDETNSPTGTLTIDDVPYEVADVPDAEAPDETDAADDQTETAT